MSQIDLNLNSRNIATYGLETFKIFTQGKYFIQGLRGLGAEVSKHIVLNSGGYLCLHDNNLIEARDLGSNFFLSKNDIGKKSRAEATKTQLKELNPNVKIEVLTGEITEEFLADFNVVVFSDCFEKKNLLKLNKFCRERNIKFIYCGILGLYYFSFNDFGDEFISHDPTGKELKKCFIQSCTFSENIVLHLANEGREYYPALGDLVMLKKTGIPELDGQKFRVLTLNEGEDRITIDCKLNIEKDIKGSIIQEVRLPLAISDDQEKFYAACNAKLEEYNKKASEKNMLEIDESILYNMIRFGDAQTCAQASILGGKVGHEILKTVGKFSPHVGFIHADNFEIIDERFDEFDTKSFGSRYDDYIKIFGKENLEKFKDLNLFLVGAGAIGCEFLKIAAVTGFCCGPKGLLTVTDDDIIQDSNRTRQFLFHKEDVKKSKSNVACYRAREFNPELNVSSQTILLTEENEQIFDDEFFEKQSALISGVDNIKARKIISNKAVNYRKPFFESGTKGSNCHSQVIVPFFSEVYQGQSESNEIAGCLLKTPTKPEICVQFAKVMFELHFKTHVEEINKFLFDKERYLEDLLKEGVKIKERLEKLQILHLIGSGKKNLVDYALKLYQILEVDEISETLKLTPADARDREGNPFWTVNKPIPKIIDFNPENEDHISFILNTCIILSFILDCKIEIDREFIQQHIKESQNLPNLSLEDEISILQNLKTEKKSLRPIELEKDDDDNGHIGFIHALTNIRCDSYSLDKKSFFETKIIAGKIIPAISTSTSFVVGLIAMELMKYSIIKDHKNFEALRNSSSCLDSPNFTIFYTTDFEPVEPPVNFELLNPEMNAWDMIEITNRPNFKELVEFLQNELGVDSINSIIYNQTFLYKRLITKPEDLNLKPREVIERKNKIKFDERKKFLILSASCVKNKVPILIPPIKYNF